jgi:phosphatidate phosphatase PAH1
MLNTWAQKGYRVAYLSARPHNLRGISRVWLHGIGAPFGPMRTADTFVHGESARTYKAQFLERVQSELGWEIVAVYGNADSDILAYEDAGIPKGVTFIVGELAGQNGTVAIGNNDYTDHVAAYVSVQPDAQQPL